MNRQREEARSLNLLLTVDEVNTILEGIGLLPFHRVYQLVAKLQQQAQHQLAGMDPDGK